MTVLEQTARSGPYNGSGTTGPFTYGFKITDATHLVATQTSALGVETTLTYPADYSVADVGEAAGGTITTTVAVPVGETITLTRNVPKSQPTDLKNLGGTQPETLELMSDRIVQMLQDIDVLTSRVVQLAISSGLSDLEMPAPSAGRAIGWNDDEDGLTNLASLSGISDPVPLANGGTGTAATTASQALAGLGVDTVLHTALAQTSLALFLSTVGAEAADTDILKADTTAELSVGFTNAVNDLGNSGASTHTLDVQAGHAQKITITGNATIEAPTAGLGSGKAGWMDLLITNDATGPHTLTFGSSFEGKIDGEWDSANNAKTLLTLRHIDGEDIYTLAQYS